MVQALVDGGTVQIWECDSQECLNPNLQNITITRGDALITKVTATISQIRDAIRNGNDQISDEAVALLGMTSVPVLDMLITGMSYQHVFVDSEISAMAEVVAVDLAMIYVDQALQEMAAAAGRLSTFGEITFEFQDQISETQNNFANLRALAAERYSQAMRTLERLALAKNELAAYSSTRFAAMLGSQ
jgi:conjugative transfer pilus assembly protein TraH